MLLIGLLYFVLSVIAITVLSVRLVKCMKKLKETPEVPEEPDVPVVPDETEGFCGACQGIGSMSFRDPTELSRLYEEGKLTEFTPMANPTEWKQTCMQ